MTTCALPLMINKQIFSFQKLKCVYVSTNGGAYKKRGVWVTMPCRTDEISLIHLAQIWDSTSLERHLPASTCNGSRYIHERNYNRGLDWKHQCFVKQMRILRKADSVRRSLRRMYWKWKLWQKNCVSQPDSNKYLLRGLFKLRNPYQGCDKKTYEQHTSMQDITRQKSQSC